MVPFKILVVPMLFLSLLIHAQSRAASKSKSRSGPKLSPKLGLRGLSRSGSRSTSGFPSRSGKRTGHGSSSSRSQNQIPALALILCPETPTLEHKIDIKVFRENEPFGTSKFLGGRYPRQSPFKVEFLRGNYQNPIKKLTITGSEHQVVCVQTLVIDTTIMIDQPTELKKTCPETPAVGALPCIQFGDTFLIPFVCPAKLTELLQSKHQINSVPEEMPTDFTPPVYDITNDMLQASGAIADGLTEGFHKVVKSRITAHKASIKSRPIGKIASFVDNFQSFLGGLGPIFSIFAGITSIATNFLTPNPFDELAKYMDKQFDLVNERLTGIQGDIADLEKIVQAQGSKLSMVNKLQSIRYAVRNYGKMMEKLSSVPVCGRSNLLKLDEVEIFFREYSQQSVDNKLKDLYEVDFGRVTEAGQGLLKPYAKAYCHSHPEYLGKFAHELSYYGFAGSLAHFAYKNLYCLTNHEERLDCDEPETEQRVWAEQLFKFLKQAEVFKVAAHNSPAALYLDVKEEIEQLIDEEVKKVSPTTSQVPGLFDKVYTLIVNKVTNSNDWSNICVFKVNGRDEGTLIIEVAEVSSRLHFDYYDPLNVPWHMRVGRKQFYVDKKDTDRSYKSAGITCEHQDPGSATKYCKSESYNLPSTPPKDRVLFIIFSPKMYQTHYQMPRLVGKPSQSVFIGYRDVYAYYDNDGDSGMEGPVHVNCWSGCGTAYETQFALIDNHRE